MRASARSIIFSKEWRISRLRVVTFQFCEEWSDRSHKRLCVCICIGTGKMSGAEKVIVLFWTRRARCLVYFEDGICLMRFRNV